MIIDVTCEEKQIFRYETTICPRVDDVIYILTSENEKEFKVVSVEHLINELGTLSFDGHAQLHQSLVTVSVSRINRHV